MKEQILEKTAEMFQRYGVRSVTMDDIANRIAISKKTIYQHFKDKKEVVSEAVKYLMNRDYEKIMAVKEGAKDEIHELVLVSQMFRKHLREINPSLLFDLKKYHQMGWSVYLEMKDKCHNATIREVLTRGQKSGLFRPEINPEIITRMRIEQVTAAFNPEIFPKDEFEFAEIHLQFFDHFVYGIVTKKGRELFEQYLEEIES